VAPLACCQQGHLRQSLGFPLMFSPWSAGSHLRSVFISLAPLAHGRTCWASRAPRTRRSESWRRWRGRLSACGHAQAGRRGRGTARRADGWQGRTLPRLRLVCPSSLKACYLAEAGGSRGNWEGRGSRGREDRFSVLGARCSGPEECGVRALRKEKSALRCSGWIRHQTDSRLVMGASAASDLCASV